jgi:hypothetical protein
LILPDPKSLYASRISRSSGIAEPVVVDSIATNIRIAVAYDINPRASQPRHNAVAGRIASMKPAKYCGSECKALCRISTIKHRPRIDGNRWVRDSVVIKYAPIDSKMIVCKIM